MMKHTNKTMYQQKARKGLAFVKLCKPMTSQVHKLVTSQHKLMTSQLHKLVTSRHKLMTSQHKLMTSQLCLQLNHLQIEQKRRKEKDVSGFFRSKFYKTGIANLSP
jgi:hypothetical protein